MTVRFKELLLGVALVLGVSTGAAIATPITAETYNISGTFADPYHPTQAGGTFSGTFAVSGTVNGSNVFTNYSITAANIAVTGFSDAGGFTFANLAYGLSNSTVAGAGAHNYFELDMTGGDDLRIYFTSAGLSTSGATIALANSYESQLSAGNRVFLNGSITQQVAAVPEPSSAALLGSGLALLVAGLAFLRRRKCITA